MGGVEVPTFKGLEAGRQFWALPAKKVPMRVVSEFVVYPQPSLGAGMWDGGDKGGQAGGIYRLGLATSQGDKPPVARARKGAARPTRPWPPH